MRGSNFFSAQGTSQFRVILRVSIVVVLLSFLYNHKDVVRNPKLGRNKPSISAGNSNGFHKPILLLPRRMMSQGAADDANLMRTGIVENTTGGGFTLIQPKICLELFDHKGYHTRCDYLIAHPECDSGGFLNYMQFFYCSCQGYEFLGYIVLGAWLAILFYLLGNTAADYFCCSLEKLSNLLNLSPTVAGVSLLPLGNGAPDVFASIAAFMGADSGELGLSSVLGGAVFVTCIVVGVVSLYVEKRRVQIDRKCFIKDLCFFLFTLACLTVILLIGRVSIGGAIAFVSIYVVYVLSVAVNEILRKKGISSLKLDAINPLRPVIGSFISSTGRCDLEDEESPLSVALLSSSTTCHGSSTTFQDSNTTTSFLSPKIPHWVWSSNVAIFSDFGLKVQDTDSPRHVWGWSDEHPAFDYSSSSWFSCSSLWSWVEIPLTIPRRLTIPIVEEERWSKFYAVSSAFFAPLLLSFLWNTQESLGALSGDIAYVIGLITGLTFAGFAIAFTSSDHPPVKFLFPWLVGGFFMSIIWFYIIASELVSLLVSVGTILGINPSLLAITILAWGNSMGDLMSNTALAMNGDRDGVQIAMSGCYAGPMFNTLVGLGISMLLGAWSENPQPYLIPGDKSLYYTLGFLIVGLVWSLIVLPQSDMRPNKILGVGLITIYLMFLCFRLSMAMGMV